MWKIGVFRGIMPNFSNASRGRAGQRIEHVRLACFVQHVVEKGPEFRPRQFRSGVCDNLNELLQIKFGAERARHLIERFRLFVRKTFPLRQYLPLGFGSFAPRYVSAEEGNTTIARGLGLNLIPAI